MTAYRVELRAVSAASLLLAGCVLAGPAGAQDAGPPPATRPAPAAPAQKQAPSGKPQAAQEVLSRVGAHEGFTRFVLEWPGPIHAGVGVRDGVVTVSFDHKGHVDIGRLNDLLPPSMRPARLHADGGSLTFRLPAGQHVRDGSRGNLVIIDLVRGDVPPPAQTARKPPEPGRPDTIGHGGPTAPVPPETPAEPPSTAPAPIKTAASAPPPPTGPANATPSPAPAPASPPPPPPTSLPPSPPPAPATPATSTPALASPPSSPPPVPPPQLASAPAPASPTASPSPTPPKPSANAPAPASPPASPSPTPPKPSANAPAPASPPASPSPTPPKPAANAPAPASPPASPSPTPPKPSANAPAAPSPPAAPPPAPSKPAANAPAPASPPASLPPPTTPPALPPAPPPVRTTAPPADPRPATPTRPAAAVTPPAVHPAPPPKPTASKTTAPPPAAKPAPPVQTAALAAGVVPAPVSDEEPAVLAETADARLRITGVPLDGGVSLRFEWSESVKAAVFKLRNTVWIVFDHPERVSFNPRLDGGGAPMPALVQATNGSATVLHLPVAEDARLIVGRAGNAWLVDIRRAGPWEKDAPVVPGRALTAKDGLYATRKPAQPVTVLDPDSGEILLAVPVRTAGVHFADNEDHRTFHVLPTAQGMLFRPESDRLRIQIEDDGARVETAPDVVTSPVDR